MRWGCVGLAACAPAIACAQTAGRPAHDPDAPDAPPRLTAIVISGKMREAIFLAPDGFDYLVVGEGGEVGAFRVTVIRPDRAELTSPLSSYTVEPTSPAGQRSMWAATASLMPLISPAYREAMTETDQ